MTATALLLTFFVAPMVPSDARVTEGALIGGRFIEYKLLFSQKIFYFHVPVAVASFVAVAFEAFFSLRYLMTRDGKHDLRARVAMEVGLLFIILTMITGDLWTRFEWGVWWVWEPRLTTYFILMILAIAYFILRTAIDTPDRKAGIAAVFGIIAFVDVPICYFITQLIPSSIHPVLTRGDSGLPPAMLAPFLIAMFGMLLVAFGVYCLRLRQAALAERLEALRIALEDEQAGYDR
jgi:heme exporter protein C